MELSHRVVTGLSAQVQQQTNKTASEMLSSCLKFKSLPSLKLFNKSITTIRLPLCCDKLDETGSPDKESSLAQTHPEGLRETPGLHSVLTALGFYSHRYGHFLPFWHPLFVRVTFSRPFSQGVAVPTLPILPNFFSAKWASKSAKWASKFGKVGKTVVHIFFSLSLFSSIRYHGSSSSIKCHVYHHVGGDDTHPWSATKVGDPIPATIPVDQ